MSKVYTDNIEKRTGGTAMAVPATGKWPEGNIADDAITLAKQAPGTQGGTVYYGPAGAPTELAAGTSGKFLKTQGTGANPIWDDVPAASPVGGGSDKIFYENGQTVTTTYTLTANNNAVSAGPVAVTANVILTGTSEWVIV